MIEGWHGLGVLVSGERLAAAPELAAAIKVLSSPEFLSGHLLRIESARIAAERRARLNAQKPAAAGRQAAEKDLGLLDEPPDGETLS